MNTMNHNSAEAWDKLWAQEGKTSWRGSAMREVYERIAALLPKKAKVIDIGGGVGILAEKLVELGHVVEVWDISPEAIRQVKASGILGRVVDLERDCPIIPEGTWVIATEVLEHLSEIARRRVLNRIIKAGGKALLSVPNFRLGPEDEPQHTAKFSAITFRKYLGDLKPRVEVLGPPGEPHFDPAFLLAVCGAPEKPGTLSLTLPVRDEGKDLGRVLASFRGAADEIVVGIDPRTKDNTREVAERYADRIINLVDPEGPVPGTTYCGPRCRAMAEAKEPRVPEGGVHFAWVRNQCLDACTSDWIFMTEGHESLAEGADALLHIGTMPNHAKIAMVWRSDLHGQRWGFPWVHRNDPKILYERGTHNSLAFPDHYMVVKLPEVRTLHERDHHRSVERAAQRKVQNRVHLMDDWMRRGSEFSKYYLASEWREFDPERAEEHFRELLALKSRNGPMRYQARLILAKLLAQKKDADGAREVLLGCVEDDWSRTEHWVWLGDLAAEKGNWEEAVQFYTYGAGRLGNPPFTAWWIDTAFYSYLPAQRLAMAFCELGDRESSLRWARVVREQLPKDAPEALRAEAEENIQLLEGTDHDDAAA
jgi:SAM-dependent methyltransferase